MFTRGSEWLQPVARAGTSKMRKSNLDLHYPLVRLFAYLFTIDNLKFSSFLLWSYLTWLVLCFCLLTIPLSCPTLIRSDVWLPTWCREMRSNCLIKLLLASRETEGGCTASWGVWTLKCSYLVPEQEVLKHCMPCTGLLNDQVVAV